jgi:hypothetical protein
MQHFWNFRSRGNNAGSSNNTSKYKSFKSITLDFEILNRERRIENKQKKLSATVVDVSCFGILSPDS